MIEPNIFILITNYMPYANIILKQKILVLLPSIKFYYKRIHTKT